MAHPLRAWQLWNEQNSPKYFSPKLDIAEYARLVKKAGKAIHEVDPGADVVLGGTWGPANAEVVLPIKPYLQELYAVKGIKKAFDSIALHPYAANTAASLAQLKAARKVANKEGDRKVGLWVTELGWAADGPTSNPYVKGRRRPGEAASRRRCEVRSKGAKLQPAGACSGTPGATCRAGISICEWCGYAGLRGPRRLGEAGLGRFTASRRAERGTWC